MTNATTIDCSPPALKSEGNLCRTCHHLLILHGTRGLMERCGKWNPGPLNKKECPDYEREPGSDDE